MADYMRHYLALKQVGLGRLVALASENDTPSRCYCDVPDVRRDDEANCSKRKWENNDVTLNASSSSTLRAAITKAGTFLFSKERKSSSKIEFDEGYTYELLNVYDRFDKLLEDAEKVVPWLRKYQETHEIYMIVAFSTAVDTHAELDSKKSKNISAKAAAPITEAIGLGASQTLVGHAADVSAEVDHSSSKQATARFTAPEERVVYICYQRVQFRSFIGKKLPSEMLSKKGKWVVTDGSRSSKEDEWVVPEITQSIDYDVGLVGDYHTVFSMQCFDEDTDDEQI